MVLRLFFRLHIWLVGFSYNFNKGEQMSLMMIRGENLLEKVKKKAEDKVIEYRESLRQMQKDAEQGYNVDDTEIRQKLAKLEYFCWRNFKEVF